MTAFTNKKALRDFLEKKVTEFNHPSFIAADPISVPHRFSKKQDIEIAGFFTSIFSWGNRTTIIQKSNELMIAMDNSPYDFILNHRRADLKRFLEFKHRTFNTTDLLYFFHFLQTHYRKSDSLETAFLPNITGVKKIIHPPSVNSPALITKANRVKKNSDGENEMVKNSLSIFYRRFF
jgi:uncharacterized protein (TIGR02757 family)